MGEVAPGMLSSMVSGTGSIPTGSGSEAITFLKQDETAPWFSSVSV